MPNRQWMQTAFVAADLCPDKPAMIEETRAVLEGLYAKRAEIDDLIGYGEELIAALKQAEAMEKTNAENTRQ